MGERHNVDGREARCRQRKENGVDGGETHCREESHSVDGGKHSVDGRET